MRGKGAQHARFGGNAEELLKLAAAHRQSLALMVAKLVADAGSCYPQTAIRSVTTATLLGSALNGCKGGLGNESEDALLPGWLYVFRERRTQ